MATRHQLRAETEISGVARMDAIFVVYSTHDILAREIGDAQSVITFQIDGSDSGLLRQLVMEIN